MNKTIKVIDLLLLQYNNGAMPKHIKINRLNYTYDYNRKTYDSEYGEQMSFDFTNNVLNMGVKIIEDKEDINIQDIKELPEYIHIGDGGTDADVKDEVNIKINEIIRAVKHLEKTKEDK